MNQPPSQPWWTEYEAWLRLLARVEIDRRFQGKFSESDAVQQTLLEAWRSREAFRGTSVGEREAWLRQILAHQLAHLARHFGATQKRDVQREVSLDQSLAQSAQRIECMLAADQATPSGIAVQREQRRKLAEVLERLPDDYRTVLILRNLEDLPHEEVARRMERSVGAVRMLWLRALGALREGFERTG